MENKLKISPFEEGILIKIFGELDSSKCLVYRDKIHKEIAKNGPRFLLFDLKECSFIDSSGIGLILGRFNEVEKVHGNVGFINLSDYARKVIRISGLFSILKEYKNLQEFKKEMRIKLWIKWKLNLLQKLKMKY